MTAVTAVDCHQEAVVAAVLGCHQGVAADVEGGFHQVTGARVVVRAELTGGGTPEEQ